MKRAALAAAAALILLQFFAATHIELTFDEAYYALWARWPQAGYYDHPPMVAWLIAASEMWLGGEFGVRALFFAFGAALPALVYLIGRDLYDGETGAAAALLLVGAPLMAGAPLATPDTPLTFFWTLSLLGLVQVWRGRSWGWALAGAAAGAAGLAKMTAGFLAAGVALALVATPSLRPQFRRWGPWAAAALALAVLAPFLMWNVSHGYATFFKQGGRLAAAGWRPGYFGEFVGSQWLLFNPLTAVVAAWRCRSPRSEPSRLLLASVAPALAYFALHALHDRVQGNWLAPLYPALALLVARALTGTRWPAPAAALGLTVAAAAYAHLAFAWPALGRADPSLRIGGWRALAAETSAAAQANGATYVLADGYAATSLLSFYGALPVVEAGEPQRWTFRPPVDTSGKGIAFGPPGFAAELRRRYARVTPVATLRRRVGGVEMEEYEVFAVGGENQR